MKATLEFDLDTQEGKMEMNRTMKALDMAIVLFDLVNNTRRKFEHDTSLDYKTLDVVFDEIYRLVEESGLNIDELVM